MSAFKFCLGYQFEPDLKQVGGSAEPLSLCLWQRVTVFMADSLFEENIMRNYTANVIVSSLRRDADCLLRHVLKILLDMLPHNLPELPPVVVV